MSNEWVMVPREPTANQLVDGAYEVPDPISHRGELTARMVYRAMLDAAPQQAEPVAWMAFGGSIVHAVTRNAMDPIEAERFDVPLYLHPPAAPQQAEPVEIVPRVWRETLRKLTFMARTSGGTPGPDEGLQTACAEAETLLSKPYNYPPAAPQQAEPVAQIGWADEFGNLFPMAAWKPAQRTHHDAHKTAWRPVFLHPPAAEVQRLREALEYLIEKCGDSDDAQYSTLGTKFVRDIARRALEGGE